MVKEDEPLNFSALGLRAWRRHLCVQKGGDADLAGARLGVGKRVSGASTKVTHSGSQERARSLYLSPVPETQSDFGSDVLARVKQLRP